MNRSALTIGLILFGIVAVVADLTLPHIADLLSAAAASSPASPGRSSPSILSGFCSCGNGLADQIFPELPLPRDVRFGS